MAIKLSKYTKMNAPPPFVPTRLGNLPKLPIPTADEIAAIRKPISED
jgi:hypothetical protein